MEINAKCTADDIAGLRILMANCEATILREIADKHFKRRDIAQTYWYCMQSDEKIDYAKINQAIIDRWSVSGLEWIKAQAWSKKCFEPKKQAA